MESRFTKFLDWLLVDCPRWLLALISTAFIGIGIGWAWLVGHLKLPERAAELGFAVLAIGVCGLGFAILRDKSDYNF